MVFLSGSLAYLCPPFGDRPVSLFRTGIGKAPTNWSQNKTSGVTRQDPKGSVVRIPQDSAALGLKTKWDDLSTAGWEGGIWVKVRGYFVVVVLPD